MDSVILVNPDYPAERKTLYGMLDDPVYPGTVPATARAVAWVISAAAVVTVLVWGSRLGADPRPVDPLLAWAITLALLACLCAPWFAKRLVTAEQSKGRSRVSAAGERSDRAVTLLAEAQRDAIRFHRMAATSPQLAPMAGQTAASLGWLLWHAGHRVARMASLEAELRAAGSRVTGPGKAAWIADRRAQIDELDGHLEPAAADVRALADLAEDAVWAMRLAQETDSPLELLAPTGHEVVAAADMAEAMALLQGWREAWMELDTRLRALTASLD